MANIADQTLEVNDNQNFQQSNNTEALPELTIKALVLGVILAIILAASNAYLGLKAGTTIAASIPAAVISMGILRLFKNHNVLENNIVQTAASAGESLVAGMIYITPALLVLGYWKNFNYIDCVLMGIGGGGLGIVCSIPIRRVLLANPKLPYPEGVAIGNVLKASMDRTISIKYLINGSIVGGLISFAQSGLEILANSVIRWGSFAGTTIGYGVGFMPALIAAGYIVGVEVCASLFLGTVIGYLISMPILSHVHNPAGLLGQQFFNQVGHTDVRYIGLGVMLFGGFVTILNLLKPLADGLKSVFKPHVNLAKEGSSNTRDNDLSGKTLMWIFYVFAALCLLVIYKGVTHSFHFPMWHLILIIGVMFVFALFASFIFSCLCGYFSGLVGATNNPLSAMVLSSLILGSFLMLLLLGNAFDSAQSTLAASVVVVVSAVVACACGLNSEVIQDLKAGQMVGATPWKQQVMLIIGTIVAAFVIPLILNLLFNAYGMAGVYPRPGMDPAQSLSAPQAAMMALVVQTVFSHSLPWPLLITGFCIAAVCMVSNVILSKRNMSILVMAVGLGIYIPLDSITPMVLGGVIAFLVKLYERKAVKQKNGIDENHLKTRHQRSLLLACGIVAGSALMGVILAVPFAIKQSTDALAIVGDSFAPIGIILSIISTVLLMLWIYFTAARSACK